MSVSARNFSPPALAPERKGSKYGRVDKLNLKCEDVLICTNNIMFDSGVVRGNTYASRVITEDQIRNREAYERKQRALLTKKQESQTKQVRSDNPDSASKSPTVVFAKGFCNLQHHMRRSWHFLSSVHCTPRNTTASFWESTYRCPHRPFPGEV
mmetsp:Transcript_12092/g.35299  ORF Transcript_12092/g.35299 Transcript_12092/m.35299 type:complete len:154 (+) Transcript_12092:1004-1465(+)